MNNPNYDFLINRLPAIRIAALQGGTRSGKTYATLQYLISLADAYGGLTISIVRESFPALRATALRDFIDILDEAGLFDSRHESKPNGYYEYVHNGNLFEFFSVDNEQKVRGRKRDILYVNEANEIGLNKFRQLAFRTTGKIIIDYNPSEGESYIYDSVLTRPDCGLIVTTYKDNPHLPKTIVEEIELLQDADPEYWKVFGEGLRGNTSGLVLGHRKITLADDYPTAKGVQVYGVDFGYSAPSVLMECTIYDEAVYWRQLIYQRKLTNLAFIDEMDRLGVSKTFPMYCDAAEPDRIAELNARGYKAIAADKSIKPGLDLLRSRPLYIHEGSRETIDEVKGYRYKKNPNTDENLEEPVGTDHAIDAGRYGVYNQKKQPAPAKGKAYSVPTKAARL